MKIEELRFIEWFNLFLQELLKFDSMDINDIVNELGVEEDNVKGEIRGSIFIIPHNKMIRKFFLNEKPEDCSMAMQLGMVGNSFFLSLKSIREIFGEYDVRHNRYDGGTDIIFNKMSYYPIKTVEVWTDEESIPIDEKVPIKHFSFIWS